MCLLSEASSEKRQSHSLQKKAPFSAEYGGKPRQHGRCLFIHSSPGARLSKPLRVSHVRLISLSCLLTGAHYTMKKNDKIMGTQDPDLTRLVFKSLQEGLMMKTPWSSLHQRQDPKGDGGNRNRGPEAGTGLQKSSKVRRAWSLLSL